MTIKINAAARLLLNAGQETGQGAGALFYCPSTGRWLICQRSNTGDAGGTWCGLGGGVDPGDKSLEHTVRREAYEEGGFGYEEPCKLIKIHSDQQPGFVFHNYIGIVPQEFDPVLNHEHTYYKWVPYSQFADHDMHPGLMRALNSERGCNTRQELAYPRSVGWQATLSEEERSARWEALKADGWLPIQA